VKAIWLIAVLLVGFVEGNNIGAVNAKETKSQNLHKLVVEMDADVKLAIQILRGNRHCRCSIKAERD